MREKILKDLAGLHARYSWRMLTLVFVLTIIFGILAGHLRMTMRWSDLLPSKDRRTIQYNKVINEFVSATSIIVVIQGEEDLMKAFAEALVPKIESVRDPKDNRLYVKRIDYKQEVEFIKDHGLMLIKADDLKNMKDVYKDPNLVPLLENLNNSLEKEYVGRDESLSTREKEDSAFLFLDGIDSLIKMMQSSISGKALSQKDVHRVVDKLLLGESYLLSYDKTTLLLNVIPNFTMMDAGKLIDGVDAVQEVVDTTLEDFPGVKAGLTGIIPVGHDEMVYGEKSISYTTFIALVAVFILLVISFRMWIAPILALANLAVGIVWAMGTATILVGTLNIMTIMMAVILVGLGIDFSIHMISSFSEGRSLGKEISVALEEAFLKSGKGILTGGLTTSIAFLTLTISSSRGMKELGVVTGAGLLSILISTFLFLPILLVFRERRLERRKEKGKLRRPLIQKDITFKSLGKAGTFFSNHYFATLLVSLVVTALLVLSATRINFDQNYMNLEPKGLPSIMLQDVVLDKFDLSMDYALILADSVDESRTLSQESKDLGSVAMTEDISLYLPSKEQQDRRIPHIKEIQRAVQASNIKKLLERKQINKFLGQLERLEMNIIEIQDLAYLGGQDKVDIKCADIVGEAENSENKNLIKNVIDAFKEEEEGARVRLEKLQEKFAPYFKETVLGMSSTGMIQLEDLPAAILDRYANNDHSQFLITVFPSGNIWQDADYLRRFVSDLERVKKNATGFPPVFRALIEIIGRDGRNAIFLTLVVVFFILWLDYRKPGHALMAMIPLTIGVFWMVGFMGLSGIKLTVVSVMGLPMIIGIGVDDGVHIVHRWRIEGKGAVARVFASTGKAILLTSLTTMLAFGSLVFSVWRGFASLGVAMFIGVGTCFLSTIVILSGIIGILERK